jgi:glycosyltransferase involved in cell wall biosynthesis
MISGTIKKNEGGNKTQWKTLQREKYLPIITIITSTFNAEKYLPSAIDSIRSQKYPYLQWIIIDGASKDNTISLLERNSDIIDIWVSEPDSGIYDAWNKALNYAEGLWIIFLGADDFIGDNWLDEIAKVDNKVDIIYGQLNLLNEDGNLSGILPIHEPNWCIRKLKSRMTFPHPGLAHNANLFSKNIFDTRFKIIGDWNFLLQSNLRTAIYIDCLQANQTLGGISRSSRGVELQYLEISNLRSCGLVKFDIYQRIYWNTKLFLSKYPKVFAFFQYLWIKARG